MFDQGSHGRLRDDDDFATALDQELGVLRSHRPQHFAHIVEQGRNASSQRRGQCVPKYFGRIVARR